MMRWTRLTEGDSRGEINKGLEIGVPQTMSTALEEVFEITLNLEIENVLLWSIVNYCLIYIGLRLCYARKSV
jgi:hypothetical protein